MTHDEATAKAWELMGPEISACNNFFVSDVAQALLDAHAMGYKEAMEARMAAKGEPTRGGYAGSEQE